jgi:hypothetical protein
MLNKLSKLDEQSRRIILNTPAYGILPLLLCIKKFYDSANLSLTIQQFKQLGADTHIEVEAGIKMEDYINVYRLIQLMCKPIVSYESLEKASKAVSEETLAKARFQDDLSILHLATQLNLSPCCLTFLIRKGADLQAKDSLGQSAREAMVARYSPEDIALILSPPRVASYSSAFSPSASSPHVSAYARATSTAFATIPIAGSPQSITGFKSSPSTAFHPTALRKAISTLALDPSSESKER